MKTDFVPTSDDDFDNWQRQFASYIAANLAALGLSAGDPDVAALAAATSGWEVKLPAHRLKAAEARAATRDKVDSRAEVTSVARRLARRLQVAPDVGDDERASMGLTRRDTKATRPPAPTSIPLLTLDFSQRLRIRLHFRDSDTPTSRARPRGTRGCELWIKIGGDPPTKPSDCTHLALATKPYIAMFEAGGPTAYFIARWMSTRGEPGPWSATASATIPG